MKKILLPLLVILSATASAQESSEDSTRGVFQAFSSVISSPTYVIACAHGYCKRILPAYQDLLVFVASEGQVRTAAVEQALQFAREDSFSGEDLQIAKEILGELSN
jgi:uncharacterized protein (TIGR02448 family)